MLPLKNRLKNREDFFAISRRGAFFSAGSVSIKVLKNEKDIPRIGFSVGLKFSKKAVERNKIKRKLRAMTSQILPRFKNNADLIIMVKKGSSLISNEALKKDLEAALKKGNLIN